jgi:hypothetical protein
MRNYRKEYDNYHSRPEQKIRRAARNAARKLFADAAPDKDVHHKDNNPLNNDKKNLSLVTQHYNRKEPRIREKKLKLALSKEDSKGLWHNINKRRKKGLPPKKPGEKGYPKTLDVGEDAVSRAKERASLKKKHDREKEAEKTAVKRATQEDMGTVTGPHIAGTGDDSSTVKVRKKKKVYKRDEGYKDKLPSDWEKRGKLSRDVRKNFWKSLKKKGRKEEKESTSDKRILDNVLAIQQKV